MPTKKSIIIALTIIVVGIIAFLLMPFFNMGGIHIMPSVRDQNIHDFDTCAGANFPIEESFPRRCTVPGGMSFVEDIGNILEKDDVIRLTSLRPNEIIESPLVIRGEARGAWFFEASFPIRLVDQNGNTIASTIAQAEGDWMTNEFVPFEAMLTIPNSPSGKVVLILEKDNPSGIPENNDALRVPFRIATAHASVNGQTMNIKVFFRKSDPTGDIVFDCGDVTSVERQIPRTPAIARATLTELLRGPTEKEQKAGFLTSIPQGVLIQALRIERDGVARVDFSKQLEEGVGGSCRVGAIRAQIEETLMQFPTVKTVQISVDGKSEGVLQP